MLPLNNVSQQDVRNKSFPLQHVQKTALCLQPFSWFDIVIDAISTASLISFHDISLCRGIQSTDL